MTLPDFLQQFEKDEFDSESDEAVGCGCAMFLAVGVVGFILGLLVGAGATYFLLR